MTISDEAVEAAAKALFDTRDDPYDMDEWDEIDAVEREPYTCQARAALEAAAPHIRAEALEEAADHIMGPSDVLLDGATCRWNAMELRERAAEMRQSNE